MQAANSIALYFTRAASPTSSPRAFLPTVSRFREYQLGHPGGTVGLIAAFAPPALYLLPEADDPQLQQKLARIPTDRVFLKTQLPNRKDYQGLSPADAGAKLIRKGSTDLHSWLDLWEAKTQRASTPSNYVDPELAPPVARTVLKLPPICTTSAPSPSWPLHPLLVRTPPSVPNISAPSSSPPSASHSPSILKLPQVPVGTLSRLKIEPSHRDGRWSEQAGQIPFQVRLPTDKPSSPIYSPASTPASAGPSAKPACNNADVLFQAARAGGGASPHSAASSRGGASTCGSVSVHGTPSPRLLVSLQHPSAPQNEDEYVRSQGRDSSLADIYYKLVGKRVDEVEKRLDAVAKRFDEVHDSLSYLSEQAAAPHAKAAIRQWGLILVQANLPHSRKFLSTLSRSGCKKFNLLTPQLLPAGPGIFTSADPRMVVWPNLSVEFDLVGKVVDSSLALRYLASLSSPVMLQGSYPSTRANQSPAARSFVQADPDKESGSRGERTLSR
ncbi:hypothetical protein BDK51DRAFT_45686 [Blyttiomyces helicus]|uniref:Uncharacterized protein n=1 Tax=Blyttiomyces helicus TaxID=388810 RepID=A0A4P9W331_9FUNG|nr:hypothetical protein BDK51DRAFT_45686 [Blyttiomyces helicus]|eukprot:RKO86172.1 hypothetical protein BDK51DRAFT_45686 [Blyttiomyces helicus]